MEKTNRETDIFYAYSFIFLEKVSMQAKILFLYLCKLADRDGKCFPSHRSMSRCCNISKSAACGAIRELEQKGILTRDRRFRHDGMQTSNWYRIKTDSEAWFFSYTNVLDMEISAQAKLVYLFFCRMANKESVCFPSRKRIGKACSIGQTKVTDTLRELESVGLIKRTAQFRTGNKGQTSNLYTVFEPG